MPVQDEVAALLATAGITGLTSANIFPDGFTGSSPDRAVAIVVYNGRGSDRVFGGVVVNEYPMLHLFVRDDQQNAARALTMAQSIYLFLDGWPTNGATSIGTPAVAYRDIRAIDGPPKPLPGGDEIQRPIYVLNFMATKDRS